MTISFLNVVDLPMWRQAAAAPNVHSAGISICADLRNDISRNPFAYELVSNAVLNRYSIVQKGWGVAVAALGMAGTFGAGASCAFAPARALRGTLAASPSTSKLVLSTALPTAVGVNMLANRGGSGDTGFRVRVTGRVVGKVEERFIVANTSGTTPTLDLDLPLTFTPALNDTYEIISGRVFSIGAGTLAAGIVRTFEVGTNTLASPATANMPATISTDTSLTVLDENYVPFDHTPGEGMVKGAFTYDTGRMALAATAASSTTITGQATLGDSVITANEYRNFQIRIVSDSVTPAAVGQRGIIASHTAGPSPVYTMGAAWTTTPSSSAKYVIELPNLLLMRGSASTTIWAYNYADESYANGTFTIAANAWSTSFAVAPAVSASGIAWCPTWGAQPDVSRNARHSHFLCWRGTGAVVDLFDLAGAAAGSWTAAVVVDGAVTLGIGTSSAHSPFGNEGRYTYFNVYTASAVNQMFRFDAKNRVFSPVVPTDRIQVGTAAVGNRMAAVAIVSTTPKMDLVLLLHHLSTNVDEYIPLV